jgi:hypothetical protein
MCRALGAREFLKPVPVDLGRRLEFGRIVGSEKEARILLVNLV